MCQEDGWMDGKIHFIDLKLGSYTVAALKKWYKNKLHSSYKNTLINLCSTNNLSRCVKHHQIVQRQMD